MCPFVVSTLGRLEAFHLATGWQCLRVCHLCSSVDWHNPTDAANWVQEYLAGVAPSPFKPGDPPPFLDIPGLGNASAMELDYCHAFHLGYGIDAAASSIVLLAKIGHLGLGALDHRLEQGYTRFLAWCRLTKRTTSIKEFSKLKFDMGQTMLG